MEDANMQLCNYDCQQFRSPPYPIKLDYSAAYLAS